MWCFHWNAWAVDKKILRESLYRSILHRSILFEIKHVMALFWNQGNRYACLGISECKMFVWSHAPVTFVDVLWSLFHLLTGTWLQDTCHLMPFTKYSLLDQSYFFHTISFTLFTDYLLRLPSSELLEKHFFRSRANRRLVVLPTAMVEGLLTREGVVHRGLAKVTRPR